LKIKVYPFSVPVGLKSLMPVVELREELGFSCLELGDKAVGDACRRGTHPADAALGDPLFRKRQRGLIFFTLFPPKAERGWSSEAKTG